MIVFRSGKQAEGRIVSENDSKVVFEGKINGIMTRTEFNKTDILAIRRGEAIADAPEATGEPVASEASLDPIDNPDAPQRVYVLELTGQFGRDISPKPIENAMRDAKKFEPDVLVVVMDNDWSMALVNGLAEQDLSDEFTNFDQFSIADKIEPLFTERIETEWSKQPRLVFWVKQAMGGAAFLPFTSPEIYFSRDARLGGIGYLDRLFGSTGDEVVRQKQYSLRLARAQGMALQGGYDPKIITALTWSGYVLSYRLEGGEPVFIEGYPDGDGAILLTDDGKDENEDTIELLARGEGNDVLTLKAELAKTLGVSKATVDSLDDLMYELGIHRNYEVLDGRSDRIMSQWRGGVKSAARQLPKNVGGLRRDRDPGRRRSRAQRSPRPADQQTRGDHLGLPPVRGRDLPAAATGCRASHSCNR